MFNMPMNNLNTGETEKGEAISAIS